MGSLSHPLARAGTDLITTSNRDAHPLQLSIADLVLIEWLNRQSQIGDVATESP
jgi:hypothetical protein